MSEAVIRVPFRISGRVDGHQGWEIEATPIRRDTDPPNPALCGWPVGLFRLSPIPEALAEQFDTDDEIEIAVSITKKAPDAG